MEWGFKENRVAVNALHECGKSDSQIFKPLKPLRILWNFIYRAIKSCKELWSVADRARSGRMKSVRAESANKTVQDWIHQNPLWKQKIMSWELHISTQSSRDLSGTIYTWQRTSVQRYTSLPPLWRRSSGQEQSVSSSGTLTTGMKTSSSRTRNFSPSRRSITTRATRLMLKHPLRCILRLHGCHHPSYVMVW